MTPPTWPREWGPNTPTERARFFLRAYRRAALAADPRTAVEEADRVARAFGEVSQFPMIDTGAELITLHEFATLAGRSVKTVRWWYERAAPSWADLPVKVGGKVRRADVIEFLDARDAADDPMPEAA